MYSKWSQDGQLQPAAWFKLGKWYFSKYYQVRRRWVFPDLVTYMSSSAYHLQNLYSVELRMYMYMYIPDMVNS